MLRPDAVMHKGECVIETCGGSGVQCRVQKIEGRAQCVRMCFVLIMVDKGEHSMTLGSNVSVLSRTREQYSKLYSVLRNSVQYAGT